MKFKLMMAVLAFVVTMPAQERSMVLPSSSSSFSFQNSDSICWSDGTQCAPLGGGSVILSPTNRWWTPSIETRKPKVPMPTLERVLALAKPVAANQIASDSYMKLAHDINLESPAIDESKLLKLIRAHSFKVYDYASVDEYLYNQALKQGTNVRWVWKPLRKMDQSRISAASTSRTENGVVVSMLYAKAVPERILEDVKCLMEENTELVALVSDYEVVRPDPFLAVTTPSLMAEGKIYVIEVWAEPGFVEHKK